jgi:hypothetical protein
MPQPKISPETAMSSSTPRNIQATSQKHALCETLTHCKLPMLQPKTSTPQSSFSKHKLNLQIMHQQGRCISL